jgi:hypothetical protein
MKINLTAVLANDAEKKARAKPLPKISVSTSPKTTIVQAVAALLEKQAPAPEPENPLLAELYAEMGQIKRQRGKLSTRTAHIVADVEKALRAENPLLVKEFLNGDLPAPELAAHYHQIESLTDQATKVWDDIRYVKEHGQLPDVTSSVKLTDAGTADENAIKYEIRRLTDLICKTQKKIDDQKGGLKERKKGNGPIEWMEKIALAKARQEDLQRKLKTVQHGR